MKYAVGMGSGGMIYIPSFINIGSGVQIMMGGGGYNGTQRECTAILTPCIPFLTFFIATSSVYRQEPINVKNSLCGFNIAFGWFPFAKHFLFCGHGTFLVSMKTASAPQQRW
jgi:hypothetical protein